MAFSSSPGAAVFIDPGQGKLQSGRQTQAITTAMDRLRCRLTGGIQRQTHHQALHPALTAEALQLRKIGIKTAAMQGRQSRHRDAEGVASGQADATAAHIQTQHRTGDRHVSGDRGWGTAMADPAGAGDRTPDPAND